MLQRYVGANVKLPRGGQRRQDDNKITFAFSKGGGELGAERQIVQKRCFFLGNAKARASPTYPVCAVAFTEALSNFWPRNVTKDKNDKKQNFRPREAREFLGRWDRSSLNQTLSKDRTSTPREFAFGRTTENSRTKIGQ